MSSRAIALLVVLSVLIAAFVWYQFDKAQMKRAAEIPAITPLHAGSFQKPGRVAVNNKVKELAHEIGASEDSEYFVRRTLRGGTGSSIGGCYAPDMDTVKAHMQDKVRELNAERKPSTCECPYELLMMAVPEVPGADPLTAEDEARIEEIAALANDLPRFVMARLQPWVVASRAGAQSEVQFGGTHYWDPVEQLRVRKQLDDLCDQTLRKDSGVRYQLSVKMVSARGARLTELQQDTPTFDDLRFVNELQTLERDQQVIFFESLAWQIGELSMDVSSAKKHGAMWDQERIEKLRQLTFTSSVATKAAQQLRFGGKDYVSNSVERSLAQFTRDDPLTPDLAEALKTSYALAQQREPISEY